VRIAHGSGLIPVVRVCRCLVQGSFFAEGDTGFTEVVRRQFQFNPIAGNNANEVFAHLSRNMGKHEMAILKLHPEHRSGEHIFYDPSRLDAVVTGHAASEFANFDSQNQMDFGLSHIEPRQRCAVESVRRRVNRGGLNRRLRRISQISNKPNQERATFLDLADA
jgi:hypothetical protein